MATISTTSYTIGAIDLYFEASIAHASLDAGDTLGVGSQFRTTSRNLGNIVTTEFNPDVSYLEHFYIGTDGAKVKDHIITQQKTLTIPFTFDEMNETNMKRYFLGTDYTTASLSILSRPTFKVLDSTLTYGSAQLYFRTDIGQDFVYMVPKCTIRPNGNMSMDIEKWWEGPMVLEVLSYNWTPTNIASTDGAPVLSYGKYGIISTAAIS